MIGDYEAMLHRASSRKRPLRMTTHLLLTSNFPPLYDGIASWMSQLARHYGDDAMLVSLGGEKGQERERCAPAGSHRPHADRARAPAQLARHHRVVAPRGDACAREQRDVHLVRQSQAALVRRVGRFVRGWEFHTA